MSLSPELRQRVLASVATVPAPTRAQTIRARVWLFVAGIAGAVAIFFLKGGVRITNRPPVLVAITSLGTSIIAGVGMYFLFTKRGRHMMRRPWTWLVAAAALSAPTRSRPPPPAPPSARARASAARSSSTSGARCRTSPTYCSATCSRSCCCRSRAHCSAGACCRSAGAGSGGPTGRSRSGPYVYQCRRSARPGKAGLCSPASPQCVNVTASDEMSVSLSCRASKATSIRLMPGIFSAETRN